MRRAGRRLLAVSPRIYCAAARSRRGRNRTIVDRRSNLLVEGFPRSGNTYVVAWLTLARPTLRIASHVHHAAHVRRAQQLGVPALIVMRHPRDAVLSNLVFDPSSGARRLIEDWIDFYDETALARAGTVVVTFEAATSDMPGVLARLERSTGLDLRPEAPPPDDAVFALVQSLGDRRFGGAPDARVARPTTNRGADKDEVAHLLDRPDLHGLLRDAEARYVELATENRR